MLTHTIYLLIAYVIDRLIGDPRALPHPVVLIGKWISILEGIIRRRVNNEKKLKAAGLLFPIFIVGGTYLMVTLIIFLAGLVSHWLAIFIEIWLISTTIATKGLKDAGMEVYHFLRVKNLSQARRSLGMIVGRDTDKLDESEISRGTVETVAENIVDAIISPFFYALIGGAPLAMAYRATNTLDSMVGYKNKKYKNLGWASARFDDLLNYIPARLTAVFILVACLLGKYNIRLAWKAIREDAHRHPSPNSGIPEAAVAGALGIQLGGTNYYNGIPSHRAKMGVYQRPIKADDIIRTIFIMKITTISTLLFFFALSFLIENMIL